MYIDIKRKFGVSTQHYSFIVKAFVEMVKKFGTLCYEFAIRETKNIWCHTRCRHNEKRNVHTGSQEIFTDSMIIRAVYTVLFLFEKFEVIDFTYWNI